MSIIDPVDAHHYVELRGRVTVFELYRTLEFVNRLAWKYTERPMDPGQDGQERFKLTVEIDSWTGQ